MKPIIQLAPIKGVTDKTFRSAFVRHFGGLDSALAPFVRMSDSESRIKSLSPELNPGIRTVPQILAKSPDEFLALAEKFRNMGCGEVNWNIGCPFTVVVKRGEGAAMLQYPDMIASFLEKVFAEISISVSVKMRLGMHSPDEIIKLMPVLNAYPVKEIAVHPRTGEQMYDGEIYLDAFESALKLSAHPVIYNGDLKTVSDYNRLRESFPSVKGWMIGRGLLINPFLAMEIVTGKIETDEVKSERIKQFIDYLLDAYIQELQSPAHVLDKMRGVWYYLSQSFPDSRKVEKRIRKAGSLNHYRDEVRRIFE
ncbi:MAG TPA: tRNA-dihydrouridine synthase family protein [Spirochaetota bacterium]|nr:tRNA-dihydrouridine synthase family protein [Spirochaetota bacterium]